MDPSLNRRMPAEFVDDHLRAPPGWYTAQCCDAWLAEDHQEGTVPRPTLRGEFTVRVAAGLASVRFKMSPEEWRKDPSTRRSVKVTDESRPQLDEYPLDYRSRLYHQVVAALQQQGASITTPDEVREALTKFPLRYQVAVFRPRDGEPRNWVKAVAPPQGTPERHGEGV